MPNRSNRFFLNPLREGDRRLATPDTGAWKDDSDQKDFLVKFGHDIFLSGELTDTTAVCSVPSVFARPILFHQAFSDKENPLHKVVVGEWRGLLALFGLQRYCGLDLRLEPYQVPRIDPNESSETGSTGESDLHLRTILRNQLPRPEEDWSRWWLIYCFGKLVGATSPWTMVYSPAQYRTPDAVPWRDEKAGTLRDPIQFYDPNRSVQRPELTVLLRWVEMLLKQREGRWGMAGRLSGKSNDIARELESWRRDLERYSQERPKVSQFTEAVLIEEEPYCNFLLSADAEPDNEGDLLLDLPKT